MLAGRASAESPDEVAGAQQGEPVETEPVIVGDEEEVIVGEDEQVVEEAEEVIIGEEEGVVVEGDEERPARRRSTWQARGVDLRDVDGQMAYVRHTGEAFDDPDQRQGLILKYYFTLDDQPLYVPRKLSRAATSPDAAQETIWEIAQDKAVQADFEGVDLTASTAETADLEWLDYNSEGEPTFLMLYRMGLEEDQALLGVYRVKHEADQSTIARTVARRLIADETPEKFLPGGLIDTLDRPADAGSKAALYGRVIAVLKQTEEGFAVDFHGEKLHEDSDCRVWLTPTEHDWGTPVAIRFVDVPIKKDSGKVAQVTALGVLYEDADGNRTQIALDFPLCSSPLLLQMKSLAARLSKSGGSGKGPDVIQILGEDLYDELSRRMVNGVYR
jgi:hypothetical protein